MKKLIVMMLVIGLISTAAVQAATVTTFAELNVLKSAAGQAGDRMYANINDGENDISYYAFTMGSGSSVVKVDNSTGQATTLFSNTSGDGWTNNSFNSYYGLSLTNNGGSLIWTDSGTDSVWTADTTTGAVTKIKDTDDIAAYTGVYGTGSNPSKSLSSFTVAPNGGLTFYEGESDTILNVALDGTLTTVTDFSAASFQGNGGKVNSGMAYDCSNNLYFADSDTDSLYRMNADGTFSTVLTTSEIAAVTSGSGVYINDVIVGEDGKIYFAEMYSGNILSYDANLDSLAVFFDASSVSGVSAAREMSWYSNTTGGYILFHDWETDIYAVAVPEPVTMLLLGLGSLGLRKRRK